MMYLVVFFGGMLGTAMRYGLDLVMPATAAPHGSGIHSMCPHSRRT